MQPGEPEAGAAAATTVAVTANAAPVAAVKTSAVPPVDASLVEADPTDGGPTDGGPIDAGPTRTTGDAVDPIEAKAQPPTRAPDLRAGTTGAKGLPGTEVPEAGTEVDRIPRDAPTDDPRPEEPGIGEVDPTPTAVAMRWNQPAPTRTPAVDQNTAHDHPARPAAIEAPTTHIASKKPAEAAADADPLVEGPGAHDAVEQPHHLMEHASTAAAHAPASEVTRQTQDGPSADMIRRVEDAVRKVEQAPPPRAITLTFEEGTRVTVSVHTEGVRISVPDGASTSPRLIADLEQALAGRGFTMAGGGSGQPRRDQPEPERFASVPAAPPVKPAQTDQGLRL
jgi:hypothetical protein